MIQTLETKIDIPTRFKTFKNVPVSIDYMLFDAETEDGYNISAIEYVSMEKKDGRQINRILESLPEEIFEKIDGEILEQLE
jgi:hypothetical protein